MSVYVCVTPVTPVCVTPVCVTARALPRIKPDLCPIPAIVSTYLRNGKGKTWSNREKSREGTEDRGMKRMGKKGGKR